MNVVTILSFKEPSTHGTPVTGYVVEKIENGVFQKVSLCMDFLLWTCVCLCAFIRGSGWLSVFVCLCVSVSMSDCICMCDCLCVCICVLVSLGVCV